MSAARNPFLAPSLAPLYGSAARLAARTSALLQAKTSGHPVPDTIASLAAVHFPPEDRAQTVADIGCGRGTSSRVLASRLAPRHLTAVDASRAMVEAARERIGATPGTEVTVVQADFHHLPLAARTYEVVTAAFCLYHSCRPQDAVAEFARILDDRGVVILVTKAADSYRELDALVAGSGLDPEAERRTSLYATAHSGNVSAIAGSALDVVHVEHEEHRFRFSGLDHVAAYLATNPKYDFAPGLSGNADALAQALRDRLPDRPLSTGSVVTYVAARPRGGRR